MEPYGENYDEPVSLPWEDRQRYGFMQAFAETLKQLATDPVTAFQGAQARNDYASPLLFAILIAVIATIASQTIGMIFGYSLLGSLSAFMPEEMRAQLGPALAAQAAGGAVSMAVSMAFTVVLIPIFTVLGIFVWSGIMHMFASILGGLTNSKAGFEGTMRAVSYASISQLGGVVPIVGGLISLIWGIVLEVIGLQRLHGMSQGKAVATVLLSLLLCCLCVFLFAGAMAAVFAGLIAAAGAAQ